MSRNSYTNLADMRPGSYQWKVKFRIIRSWRGVSTKGESFKSLNILLLDDKVITIFVKV